MSKLMYIIIGVVLLLGGSVFFYKKIRGIRNNNPGNIRRGDKWLGMRAVQTDPDYVQFTKNVFGIRAINRILRTYQQGHDIDTVRGVIERWAPSEDSNDTESYIDSVAGRVGVSPDAKINLRHYAAALTRSIIKHENGVQPYSDSLIQQGVRMGWA